MKTKGLSDLLGMVVYGANFVVGILKWAALLYVLVQITLLGFKILKSSKDGADAIQEIKGKGVALAIGLFVVLSAFLIHGSLQDGIIAITGADKQVSTDGFSQTEDKWDYDYNNGN